MPKNEKIMHLANFNITFGKEKEPMLEHFLDIIFPAFTSGFKRGLPNKPPQFYFDNVGIDHIDDEYVLVGNYIKDTELEVYTVVEEGELVSKPSLVPTAPYSRFIIFLKNHRMILIRNESRSPDVRSFQNTLRASINQHISHLNKITKGKALKVPKAMVNIVDIPLPYDIDAALKNITKISWLKLRFFPLNNDINPFPIAEHIKKEMERLDSEYSHTQFTSPKSKQGVKEVIYESSALAVATLEGKDVNGVKVKIKEGQLSSNIAIPLDDDLKAKYDEYFVFQAKKNDIIKVTSDANAELYEKYKKIIGGFFKKKE